MSESSTYRIPESVMHPITHPFCFAIWVDGSLFVSYHISLPSNCCYFLIDSYLVFFLVYIPRFVVLPPFFPTYYIFTTLSRLPIIFHHQYNLPFRKCSLFLRTRCCHAIQQLRSLSKEGQDIVAHLTGRSNANGSL